MTRPRSALNAALLLACALACHPASAQPAPSPSAAASAAERAQKETDRTMYWIRVLATKPAPAKAVAAAAPKPVPAVALASARPATETREKVRAAASTNATPEPTGATTVALAQAQAPAADAAQHPFGDLAEPSALSSSGADTMASAAPATAAPMPQDAAPPVDTEPDPGLVQIASVQPDFPAAVVRRVHKGNVEVRFEVDPGGQVVDATVVDSSNARLNAAAVEAIRQWRFKPTPKSHTALVNLVFNIDNES